MTCAVCRQERAAAGSELHHLRKDPLDPPMPAQCGTVEGESFDRDHCPLVCRPVPCCADRPSISIGCNVLQPRVSACPSAWSCVTSRAD